MAGLRIPTADHLVDDHGRRHRFDEVLARICNYEIPPIPGIFTADPVWITAADPVWTCDPRILDR